MPDKHTNADKTPANEPTAPSTNRGDVPDGEEGSINTVPDDKQPRTGKDDGSPKDQTGDRPEGDERRTDDL